MQHLKTYLKQFYEKGLLSDTSIDDVKNINSIYPVLISKHICNQINSTNSYGLARQFLPDIRELVDNDGAGAFFPEEKHTTETLVQKYPNRCIIYTTSSCFANCRHCSRKEKWKDNYTFSMSDFDQSCSEISNSPYFDEVILTGGDVLTNSDDIIDYMLNRLSQIPHIKVIRLGTRAFTSSPSRITDNLCKILSKYDSLVILTQFNHPDEFSEDTIKAIKRVQKTGCPILNQSVLLKGVNDLYSVMKDLLTLCVHNRIIPYYLFHCFKIKGAQYMRTDVRVGYDIINKLVGTIGGWWIPRYTIIPNETGIKIPVCQNGIIKEFPNELIVTDFKGREFKYD